MPHPLVINITAPAEDDEDRERRRTAVFVGRPSKWGNPFPRARWRTDARRKSIEAYEKYLKHNPELMAALGELRGRVLACYCAPLPCHADVLARLANGA